MTFLKLRIQYLRLIHVKRVSFPPPYKETNSKRLLKKLRSLDGLVL